MAKKDAVVFGLGRFGSSVAINLEKRGYKVLAVDIDEKRLRQIADYVTVATKVDVSNEEAMEELGISNFDIAIIAMGHNLESTILTVLWAKEHGIKTIIAKAYDDVHGRIISKMGVDEVIYPEREMGKNLANRIALDTLKEAIQIDEDYAIVDVKIPDSWVGRTLKQLKLREKYQVNIIAIKRNGKVLMIPNADAPTVPEDVFVMIGDNEAIKRINSIS